MTNFYGILLSMVSILGPIYASPISHCPSKCNCDEGTVKCVDKRLLVIPDFKNMDKSLKKLDLSGNDIEEIKETNLFFGKLTTLQFLHLNDNSIVEIETTAFSPLINLKYLDLSNNLLTNIPSHVIQTNINLKELNLSGNLFSSETPELISTSLKILDLSFSKISEFTENSLQSLPNLRVLYLHANNLKHIDYNIFLDVVHLRYVDLSFNLLKCHCDTIELFDKLVNANVTKIDKPIQCVHSNKRYEDIYNSRGAMNRKKLCKKEISDPRHQEDATEDLPMKQSTKNNNNFPSKPGTEETVFYLRWEVWVGTVSAMLLFALFTKFIINKYKKANCDIYAELDNGRTSSTTLIIR